MREVREVQKMFQHVGPRSPETDEIAETVARHTVLDEWLPEMRPFVDITLKWVHHNIPDVWLLFATGVTK